jgi:hypothetical protein
MKKQITLIFSLIFVTASLAAAQTARRTITNNDLEKYRQARVQAEADYRANYKKLGMPSPEELERMDAERRAWHTDFSRKTAVQNRQSENYFLAQANALKAEIVNVQAQINYLRGQIGNLPNQNSIFVTPDQVLAVGVLPGGRYGQLPGRINRTNAVNLQAPNVQTARNAAAAMPNPYAGTALQNMRGTGVKVVIGAANPVVRGRRGFGRPFYYGGYALPYAVNSNSTRDQLVANLKFLEQTKAGLLAQFEMLREEARRAGVRID